MNKYGISNISNDILNYRFDVHYREVALKLKEIKNIEECNAFRKIEQKKLSDYIDVQIDLQELKKNFINLILDDDSSKLLWILYSKYDGEENYLDKISNILKMENKVIRGGTNTYKMNGWMAHTLYVYQIANYNIPNNKELTNFNGNMEIKNQINKLHNLYKKLDNDLKFILKIFALIHDIGVIEDVKLHPELGVKYVETVIDEIGITEEQLKSNNIQISLKDLIQILKVFVKYHILVTMLSTEGSDNFVEFSYRDLISCLPNVKNIKSMNPEILLIFAYGDIIGVDEKLMDKAKFNRIIEGYNFFEAISQNKIPKRDKEKVAIERICDTVGKVSYEELKEKIDTIFNIYDIEKQEFIDDMYNIKYMRFAGPLMKTVNDVELTIRIYAQIFDVIRIIDKKEEIKNYTIIFVPDKHEDEFAKHFKNGNFFECINKIKKTKLETTIYKNVKIEIEKNNEDKKLQVRIVE